MDQQFATNTVASQRVIASSYPNSTSDSRSTAEITEIIRGLRLALDGDLQAARAAALQLVAVLTPANETQAQSTPGGLAPWQMRKVDRYVRERLECTLRLSELADKVSLSVSHFCRAFKNSFGVSPHAYIVRLRLELAQDLMLSSELPLSQIALSCGLADQAHLSKLFRREIGESPRAWRRRSLSEVHVQAVRARNK